MSEDTTRIYMEYLWSKEAKKNVQSEFNFTCNFCHCDDHSLNCVHYVPNIGKVSRNRYVPHDMFNNDITDSCVWFDTIEELLEIVKHLTEIKDFYRFSISSTSSANMLMAEYNNGKKWWVIGYIKDTSYLQLPKWETKE